MSRPTLSRNIVIKGRIYFGFFYELISLLFDCLDDTPLLITHFIRPLGRRH